MACAMEISRKSHHWAELALAAPFVTLVRWYRVAEERRTMMEMSSERLEDLGLSRDDVIREAARPFWDTSSRNSTMIR